MTKFEWPCDRRDAHHSHTIQVLVWTVGDENHYEDRHCPGVGAHPATQIGGNYDEW